MTDIAPRGLDVLMGWSVSPVADILILIATVGYLLLVRRLGRRQEATRWPRRRVVAWASAMVALVVALDGPVAVYGDALFWVHMLQHLLLIMVVPVLVVWAQPLGLLRRASGERGRAVLDRILGSRAVRVVTFPLAALAVYAAVVVLTHLTGFQQLAVTHAWVRDLETVLYLASGYLFFLPLVGSEIGPWSLPYLLRFVLLALAMGVDTLTGVALMLTSRSLAPAYAASHPGWGPGALADQGAAGAVMWFGGDGLMMILMIIVAVQWGLADQDQQGLGTWLEGVRRRTVLGAGTAAGGTGEFGADIDDDQRALDAYNAALAALNRRDPSPDHSNGQT